MLNCYCMYITDDGTWESSSIPSVPGSYSLLSGIFLSRCLATTTLNYHSLGLTGFIQNAGF